MAKEDYMLVWDQFLSTYPPGRSSIVSGLTEENYGVGPKYKVLTPDLLLYCASDTCSDFRYFGNQNTGSIQIPEDVWKSRILFYECRNCRETEKIFAVKIHSRGEVVKIGEWPPFGPHIPSRVITLIGPDRDFFLKGRRAESQGLGIAAFAYYRRVVENQKGRLIEEIIKVAKQVDTTEQVLERLETAKSETQFSKAVDDVKEAIPEVLRIKGHNPLTLLHSALSEGLHSDSDEDCLELAISIRVVLTELADRIGQALKDQTELDEAVNKLLEKSRKKKVASKNTEGNKSETN